MTRILIADDHAVLREGLKQILAEEFPDARFGEAGTVAETLAQLDTQAWDVLLLDIFMPEGNGLEVLRETAGRWPNLAVLVLSSAPEEQMARRVLRAGAAGYISKQSASEDLVLAVKKVLSGGTYVGARVVEKLITEATRPARSLARHETLSDREFQVLQLLVAGKSLKAIAADLALSPKTVSTFHIRILEKLQLQNDVELVHYALEHGLSERSPAARPKAALSD